MLLTLSFSTGSEYLRPQMFFLREYSVRIREFFLSFISTSTQKRISKRENMMNSISPPSTEECFFFCFFDLAKVTPRVAGVTFSTCALVSSVTVSALHSRTLPRGLSLKQNRVFTFGLHRLAHCALTHRNQPETQKVRGDPQRLRILNLWLYRQNFRQLFSFLRLMPNYRKLVA